VIRPPLAGGQGTDVCACGPLIWRNGVGYPFQGVLGCALCFPIRIAQPPGRPFRRTMRPACFYGIGTAGEGVPDTVFLGRSQRCAPFDKCWRSGSGDGSERRSASDVAWGQFISLGRGAQTSKTMSAPPAKSHSRLIADSGLSPGPWAATRHSCR
jgi:hypothetical protein